MQIGADIFCDSECILRALDQRIPEPELYPNIPIPWDASGVFNQIFRLALVFTGDALPAGFVEDRGRLYLGANWNMATVSAQIPDVIATIQARFKALDTALSGEHPFLAGPTPIAMDANAYHLVWFLRGRWADGPALLSELPHVLAWEQRMLAINHGAWTDMPAREALDIARNTEPAMPTWIDENDPLGLKIGQRVAITPDGDGGDPEVLGIVHFADAQTIAILHHDDRVGAVCIHFPRTGYRIRID